LRAKAALDNAQAALYNAQAQLESIKVQAEADLKAAQAEYYLAQAKYQDSQTELNKAALKEREAYYKYQILSWESQYNQLLVTAEQALLLAQRNLRDYKTGELTALIGKYSTLLSDINSSKRTIALYTISLAKAELELDTYSADSARFVDNTIISLKSTIRSDSLIIVDNTKKIAEWEAFVINDDAADKIAEKEAELAIWVDTVPILRKASLLAAEVYEDAQEVANSINDLYNAYVGYTQGNFQVPQYAWVAGTSEPEWTEDGVTYTHKGTWGPNDPDNTYVYSGYSANRGYAVYSYRHDYNWYQWYRIYNYDNNNYSLDGRYTSVEDYKHKNRQLVVDTANYKRDYNRLLAQYNSLTSKVTAAGNTEYNARIANEDAKEAYEDAKEVFDSKIVPGDPNKPTSKDTADYLPFVSTYLGTNVRGVVVDTKGGTKGVWEDAVAKYNALQDSIRPLNQQIIAAGEGLINSLAALETYSEAIEILSSGSRGEILVKLTEANNDVTAKLQSLNDANTAYNDASQKTGSLRREIDVLSQLWGLRTNPNSETVYESQAVVVIQVQIDWLQTGINNAQANIENNKRNLANITLYATDNGNAVELAIEYKKIEIEKFKAEIANEEQKLVVYEAELKIVQAGIDSLLAEKPAEGE
jgi:hypothetical protein